MALKSINEISPQKNLTPNSESARILQAQRDRDLFDGKLHQLNVEYLDSATPPTSINWFRRIAQFYPEFLLAERPQFVVEGNARLEDILTEFGRVFFPPLQRANVHMLTYGLGVLASHPQNPMLFIPFERDKHYEVVDEQGLIVADILISIDGEPTETERILNVYVYEIDGPSTWKQYNWQHGAVGQFLREIPIPPRTGRQVALMDHNQDRTSIFTDLIPLVGQQVRIATGVGRTVKRNSAPHLFGPDGMLTTDAGGRIEIESEGMFLPIQEDDPKPEYLQWDSKVEASQWLFDTSQLMIFAMSGLSPLLFDPSIQTGILSGEALRRAMLPFVARLNHYARINEETIETVLNIWNANRGSNGLEVFSFDPSDIVVEWAYNDIFSEQEDEDNEQPERPEPGQG